MVHVVRYSYQEKKRFGAIDIIYYVLVVKNFWYIFVRHLNLIQELRK